MTTIEIEIRGDIHPDRRPEIRGDIGLSLRDGLIQVLQQHGLQEAEITIDEQASSSVQITTYSTKREDKD